jgi:hypothetical protein
MWWCGVNASVNLVYSILSLARLQTPKPSKRVKGEVRHPLRRMKQEQSPPPLVLIGHAASLTPY